MPEEEHERIRKSIEEKRERDIAEHMEGIRMRETLAQSSLSEEELKISFDSLKVIEQNRDAIRRVRRWNHAMIKGIVLYGPVGTGKSTLLKAVINRYAGPKFKCLFISVPDVMQRFKNSIDSPDTTMAIEEKKLASPDLLILDDLGVGVASEWGKEKLFSLFEARAKYAKHTFFTTNLSQEDVEKNFGDRIFDRMMQYCTWIPMNGKSFRRMNYVEEI